jgi:hypothetical protein
LPPPLPPNTTPAHLRSISRSQSPQENATTRCSSCNNIPFSGKLRNCSACQSTAYCNLDCQKAHWATHKKQCKKLKDAKIAKITAKAAEKISQDDLKVIVNNDRLVISRCKDPDGFIYSQFMPKDAYGDYINATKPECWCAGVGQDPSALVVFPFDLADLKPGPSSEVSAAKLKAKHTGGYLQSQYLSAFGTNFQIHVSEMLGNLSVCLSEEPDTSVPFDTHAGITVKSSYFFLSGKDAMSLQLPPPSKGEFRRAGETTCNSHLNVWSRVGSKASLGLHEIKAIPRVPGAALKTNDFVYPAGGMAVPSGDCVAIALLVEKMSDVSTIAEFETASIACQLHDYHSKSRPDEEIPEFCKDCCRKGLKDLNMNHPVNLVALLPKEEGAPAPAPAAAPSSGGGTRSATPAGLDGLSPGSLTLLQGIMVGIQNQTPDMAQIEEGLGDPELGPVLQNILGTPEVAPLMARMMSQMSS